MASVMGKEHEPLDAIVRRFKRACEKDGILADVRKREFYEKPTWRRKRKAAAARKRQLKRLQKEQPHRRQYKRKKPSDITTVAQASTAESKTTESSTK